MQNKIVDAALKAMLYEVTVNPKPGLVDSVTNGSRQDMNAFTFIDSTLSLKNYFEAITKCGKDFSGENFQDLFLKIRPLGLEAEKNMFDATHQVNTHKRVIFSLGVLVTAASYTEYHSILSTENIITVVRAMLLDFAKNDFKSLTEKSKLTAGEKQYIKYGFTGIRGEAEAGFPTVVNIALPFLRKTDGEINQRLLDTLMIILANLEDSNLIKRAGNTDILTDVEKKVRQYFECSDKKGFLRKLDKDFTDRNLSIGGSADLLVLTIFFRFIRKNTLMLFWQYFDSQI